MIEVLSEIQLKRLKEHKYKAECVSVMEPYMQPFWNWLVNQIPLWWAPNAITLAGLIINVATASVLILYSPDARQTIPCWASLLCAIGLFVYQSLDAIDGKQARRTKSGSPLGELFDHGCDAISMGFVVLGICLSVELGDWPILMFLECVVTMLMFYSSHWQTYVSGVMRFGYIDVTEAQFGVILVLVLSAFLGSGFWSREIPVLGLPLKLIPSAFSFGAALAVIRTYFTVILYEGGSGKNGSTIAGTSVLSPLIPITIPMALGVMISYMSKTGVYSQYTCLYLICFLIIMGKIAMKLVVAHMTRSEITTLDSSLIGPGMLFLNQYFNYVVQEHIVLWMCFIFCSIDLIRYFTLLCLQISDNLDISVFTIKPPRAEDLADTEPTDGASTTQKRHSTRLASKKHDQ